MRRVFSAALLALFVLQSSGAAAAAQAPPNVRVRPLIAEVQFAFGQMLQSLQSTHVGAFVLGRESQYEAMHAPPPDFRKARAAARTSPVRPDLHPALVRPIFHAGVLVRPRTVDVRSINMRALPRDPLAMPRQNARLPQFTMPRLSTPAATPLRPSAGTHIRKISPMTVGATAGSGVTGINPWWTYEEGAVPGVGKWMVNVATGNLIVQADDVDVPERGIDLAFRRTYNSQSQHDFANTDGSVPDVFGNGWTSTTDAHLSYNATGPVMTVWDIDGARYDYTASNGAWVAPPGMQGTSLTWDGGCGYFWTKKSGTVYYFWSPNYGGCAGAAYSAYNGRLYMIYARNHNNYVRFDYYWAGDASTISHLDHIVMQHSDGQALTLQFGNVSGYTELAYIMRPDGQVMHYNYDSSANLIDVCDVGNGNADGSPSATTVCGDTTHMHHRYGWNANHQMAWADTPRWTMNWGGMQPDGSGGGYVAFGYNGSNQITSVQRIGHENLSPTDGTGTQVQPGYPTSSAAVMGTTAFTYPSTGETALTDTDGHATNWFYDSAGRTTETQEWTGAPNNLWLTTYASWDASNNLTESVDARGNATDYGYDGNGNTIWVQQPWITTSMGYGRPVARYSYDQYNNLVAYCDPQYIWTTGATSCNAGSGVTHYTWNYSDVNEPYGRLTDTYTPLGYHHAIAYNTAAQASGDYGLPTDVTGDCISQADGSNRCPHLTMVYDSFGNVACYSGFQDGSGTHWSRAAYDGLNRRVATADADDSSLSVGQCTNAAGLPGSHIQTTTTYYQNGQVASTQTPSEYAAGVSSTYAYDADGNLIASTSHTGGVLSTTKKWYDGADRLVEVQEPQDNSDVYGFAWLTRYIYDLSQNGASARPSIGGQALVAYGNLATTQECLASTTVTAPYSSKPTVCTFTNMETKGQSFDALDRLTGKYSFSGPTLYKETLSYDAAGQAGFLSSDCNGLNQCKTPSYDSTGAESAISYSDGTTGNLTYAHDPDGRTASIASPYGTQGYTYDADGRVSSSTEPNSGGVSSPATLTYHYYADGSRQSLDVASSALNQTGLFTYTYREDGKVQWQEVTDNALPSANTAISFAYTAAGRETGLQFSGAGRPAAAPSYAYDGYGRLLSQTLTTSIRAFSMAYDPEGEINSYLAPNVNYPSQNDTWAPQYSARGEVTGTLENGMQHEQYNFANGVALGLKSTMSSSTITFDARMGVVTNSVGSKCLTTTYGTGCPSMTLSFDGIGRMATDVQATPQKDDIGDIYYNTTNATNSYDSENRLIATTTTQTKGINQITSGYDGAAYKWGPNGHPIMVGTTCCASTAVSAYDTLHWDGGQLLFTTNASGVVDDIKVGTLADITPGDPLYSGITFYARTADHSVEACYNTSGAIGYLAFSGTRTPGMGCSGGGSMSIPEALAPGAYSHIAVGAGRVLMYWRTDGLYDGINTIQGVRAFSSDTGGWTTPDAYAGDVLDPMSLKSYVWNGNNPNAYSDPSGYDPLPNDPSGLSDAWVRDNPEWKTVRGSNGQWFRNRNTGDWLRYDVDKNANRHWHGYKPNMGNPNKTPSNNDPPSKGPGGRFRDSKGRPAHQLQPGENSPDFDNHPFSNCACGEVPGSIVLPLPNGGTIEIPDFVPLPVPIPVGVADDDTSAGDDANASGATADAMTSDTGGAAYNPGLPK